MSKYLSRRVRRVVLLLVAASLGACHFHGHCSFRDFCRPVRHCR